MSEKQSWSLTAGFQLPGPVEREARRASQFLPDVPFRKPPFHSESDTYLEIIIQHHTYSDMQVPTASLVCCMLINYHEILHILKIKYGTCISIEMKNIPS
jgi:hypothetical protein